MSKAVVFRCKQKNWNLAHEEVFHVGVVLTPYVGERWIGSEEQWEALQKLPDPEKVNSSYVFSEGVEHNELTLYHEAAIEGMRAYIAAREDDFIEELGEKEV